MTDRAKVRGRLTLAVIVVAVVASSAYVNGRKLLEANGLVSHSHQVLDCLDRLLAYHVEAETGQRGYVLTGTPEVLEPYTAATRSVPGEFSALATLVGDDVQQLARLEEARSLSAAKLDELRETVDLRRRVGFEPAMAVVRTGRGEAIMGRFRDAVGRMRDAERRTLLGRTAIADAVARRVIVEMAMWTPVLSALAMLFIRGTKAPTAAPRHAASRRPGRLVLRYGFAVVTVAAAAAVRWGFGKAFGPLPPFVTFFPAVVVVAGVAGAGPGVVSIALSCLTAAYMFLAPLESFAVSSIGDLLATAIFACTTFFICLLAGRLQDARSARAATRQTELLAVTLTCIGDGVVVTDVAGRVTFLNAAAERFTGWALADARGRPLPSVFCVVDESTRATVENPAEKVLRTGLAVGNANHTLLLARDGRELAIDNGGAPVREADGSLTGVVLVFRDVSERRVAEDALRDSELRFRTMADAMPQLAWTARADGYIEWYNRRWYEYTATAPADMEGWGWQAVHDPAVLPAVMERWTLAIATQEPFEMVIPLRGGDGQFRSFLTRVRPFKDADGQVIQWFGTNTDVDAMLQAQAVQARLAAIIESSDDAILSKRLDGTILTWNAAAERLFGYRAAEIVGKPITLLVPLDRLAEEQGIIERLRRGERCDHVETVRVASDGRRIDVSLTISPLRDADGRVIGASKIARDVTGQKRDREAVAGALRQAEEAKVIAEAASRIKDHFIAVLSHELRTPLNPVLATATMLRADPKFDADTRDQLDLICKNVEAEVSLIDDLLDVTRIERGKTELDLKPIELGAVLHAVLETYRPEANAKCLVVRAELGNSAHWANGDAARLRQVFSNLLKNAIKFTPPGGRVEVGIHVAVNGLAVVRFTDSGVGIEPEAIARIFNAFEQADRSITRHYGGLGLGLTISKAMTELHGGLISATSDGPGKGATFEVRLPLCPAGTTPPPRPADTAPTSIEPVTPLRILLVEDHADTARVMIRLLASDGHQVTHAADVASSLEYLDEGPFDLLICDLGLPDGSGWDIMRTVRAGGSDLRGIALSGYGQEADIAASLDVGYLAHLTKPVDVADLLMRIRELARDAASIAAE